MSLGSPVLVVRVAVRGLLQFRAADGSIVKEVEIVGGDLPLMVPQPTTPESLNVPGPARPVSPRGA